MKDDMIEVRRCAECRHLKLLKHCVQVYRGREAISYDHLYAWVCKKCLTKIQKP